MSGMQTSSSDVEDSQPTQKRSRRRSRKSGCSNIFSGVNLQQLRRLFRSAGDRDAEQRAKLVWRGMDTDTEGAVGQEEEEEEVLARALVGLRVRARNKAGTRVGGHKEHRWFRASGYLRFEDPLPGCTLEDDSASSPEELLLRSEESVSVCQSPLKSSAWRFGVAKLEGARDSERYLHRILH